MSTFERRNSKRVSVAELDVYDKESKRHLGKMINLSLGGMLIVGDRPFETGSEYALSIPFMDAENGEIDFVVRARCAWCTITHSYPQYSIGMEFLENSAIQFQFIKRMISVYSN